MLGGTVFVGRHVVEAALARGHEVTLFNRGRRNPGLFPDVEKLRGDRDGDLAALRGRRFDAVVDPSGFTPHHVQAVAATLGATIAHYPLRFDVSEPHEAPTRGRARRESRSAHVLARLGRRSDATDASERAIGPSEDPAGSGLLARP